MHFTSITIKLSLIAHTYVSGAVVGTSLSATNTQALQIGGHTITVGTVPISAARLAQVNNVFARSPIPTTSLTKRVVNNACEFGCSEVCTNDLSPSLVPPTLDDCTALKNAVQQLAQSELTTTFPCNFPNQPNCPNFSVSPGFERFYSIGTCLVGFANLNPIGGPDLSFCDFLMAGRILPAYSNCITQQNFTGSVCFQSLQTGIHYGLEVRHV